MVNDKEVDFGIMIYSIVTKNLHGIVSHKG